MILGRRARIIKKSGHVLFWSHIEHFQTLLVNNKIALQVDGETDDIDGTRVRVSDKFFIEDLIDFQIEFYTLGG